MAVSHIFRCCLVAALAMAAPSARADGLLEGLGRATGLIAPPPDPPDFVKASRPAGEPAEIPVFAAPQEPRSTVKSASELSAMDADLERAGGVKRVKPKRKAAQR